MKKTVLIQLIEYLKVHEPSEIHLYEIIEYAQMLLEDEREQIVSAWVQGNAEGWAMTTDHPESGERYYEEKYGKAKTSTH